MSAENVSPTHAGGGGGGGRGGLYHSCVYYAKQHSNPHQAALVMSQPVCHSYSSSIITRTVVPSYPLLKLYAADLVFRSVYISSTKSSQGCVDPGWKVSVQEKQT